MADQKLTDIPGVGEITAAKLIQNDITTVEAVANAELVHLMAATDFPVNRVTSIQEGAAVLLQGAKPYKKKKSEKDKKKKKDKRKKKKDGKKDKGKKKNKKGKKK